jgi:hypothetical protein
VQENMLREAMTKSRHVKKTKAVFFDNKSYVLCAVFGIIMNVYRVHNTSWVFFKTSPAKKTKL